MEKRNVTITLKQAKEWYEGNNCTLKTLALSAYSKEELEDSYDSILTQMRCSNRVGSLCSNIAITDELKFKANAKLMLLAAQFNGVWKMKQGATGYFIGKLPSYTNNMVNSITGQGVGVFQHNTVHHAGIVYFKNVADAVRAGKILGDEIQHLFL